jgi:hypothetical protein
MPFPDFDPDAIQIVWPTRTQREVGLAALSRYLPTWKASPALLVIKPNHALIVSISNHQHDDHGFQLVLAVSEALVAPDNFDISSPIRVGCVWNQPYMSMDAEGISAPYSFSLQFGAEGVQRAREASIELRRELSVAVGTDDYNSLVLGCLKGCFCVRK